VVFGESFISVIKVCVSIYRNSWNTGLSQSREFVNHWIRPQMSLNKLFAFELRQTAGGDSV
jgi:hypothetical protein